MGDRSEHDAMKDAPPVIRSGIPLTDVYSSPWAAAWFMRNAHAVAPTASISARTGPVTAIPSHPVDLDYLRLGDADGGSWTLAQMLAETATDAIVVLKDGCVIYERRFGGLDWDAPRLCFSITKSIASCVAANLVGRGVIDPDGAVAAHVPELEASAYGDATIRHLLDMTVGVRYVEDRDDPAAEGARLCRLCGLSPSRAGDEPGSTYRFATTMRKEGQHGRTVHYVSLNTDVLGWVMERASGLSVPELISREVWSKLAEDDACIILDGAGSAQLDSGLCASLRDLVRFAQMLLDGGRSGGAQVVPASWIDDVAGGGDAAAFAAAPDCADLPRDWSYRGCFWVGAREDGAPIMALGMYGQMIYVDRARRFAAVKLSSQRRAVDDPLVTRTSRALRSLSEALESGGA